MIIRWQKNYKEMIKIYDYVSWEQEILKRKMNKKRNEISIPLVLSYTDLKKKRL